VNSPLELITDETVTGDPAACRLPFREAVFTYDYIAEGERRRIRG